MRNTVLTVASAGESGTLTRIIGQLGAAPAAIVGPGDDCAVLAVSGELVVTSDMMIEGPDFRLAWHSGFELGWKLAATNLSDVAAMGAVPTALTVALACPGETPVTLLEEIARGLNEACAVLAPGCGIVGGDLSRAPVMTASITALGQLPPGSAVLRSGARVGNQIAYAGELGLAGLGLSLLFAEASDEAGDAQAAPVATLRRAHPAALQAQLAPRPPVALGAVARAAGATAMLDVSDGLTLDAARVAHASGVTMALDSQLLMASFGSQLGETVPLEAMLYGGEDHGLLATFPYAHPLPEGFSRIGEVRSLASPVPGRVRPATPVTLDGAPVEARGWDPFTVRPPGS